MVDDKIIETRYVFSANQLVDLSTKPFGSSRVRFISDKLGMYDVYAPALRSVRIMRMRGCFM